MLAVNRISFVDKESAVWATIYHAPVVAEFALAKSG